MGKIYIGDVGTEIIINLQTDITTATNILLNVKKPNGTDATWIPAIYDEKYLRYIIQSGDFNQYGRYVIQPSLTLGIWSGNCKSVSLFVNNTYS